MNLCIVQSEVSPEAVCEVIPDIEKGSISICSHTVLVGAEFYYRPYEARLRAVNDYGEGVLSGIATVMSAEESELTLTRSFSLHGLGWLKCMLISQ